MRTYETTFSQQHARQREVTYVVRVAEPEVGSVPAWAVVRNCDVLTPWFCVKYYATYISRFPLPQTQHNASCGYGSP